MTNKLSMHHTLHLRTIMIKKEPCCYRSNWTTVVMVELIEIALHKMTIPAADLALHLRTKAKPMRARKEATTTHRLGHRHSRRSFNHIYMQLARHAALVSGSSRIPTAHQPNSKMRASPTRMTQESTLHQILMIDQRESLQPF